MRIRFHPGQSQVFNDLFVNKTIRNAVTIAARGWGKSFFAAGAGVAAVNELLQLKSRVPNKNVYIVAPTYSQVVDIYYPLLAYEMGMEEYAIRSSQDSGTFWFPRNVKLKLVSYEAVERLRGTGAYFVVLDEPSSWLKGIGLKEAWEGIIQPCISTRWSPDRARQYGAVSAGRSLTIGTPKGYNHLYDMYNYQETDDTWKSYHYDYTKSPYLDPKEIERIRHTIDPMQFNREYLALFQDSSANVFYCFDRRVHVQRDLPYFMPMTEGYRAEDVHVAIDFNVGIQASSAWAIRGGQPHCLDEFQGHPDTETLARVLKAKYKDKGHTVYVYPDPTGNSRKTSAAVGTTDFSILRSAGLNVLARQSSPSIIDSVASVNRKFKTAAGDVDAFIHPSCSGVIKSLERTTWVDKNPDLAVIDKKAGDEHYSDGVRYFFEYRFPVLSGQRRTARGFNF